ncbi:hypothetical protein Fot_19512 [Forsythia ovata]|uniref:Uncharacterized protein n=1 Tax=Forsythia ovata TaxID=205694 RepID=A0ABD1VL88_9LAMI
MTSDKRKYPSKRSYQLWPSKSKCWWKKIGQRAHKPEVNQKTKRRSGPGPVASHSQPLSEPCNSRRHHPLTRSKSESIDLHGLPMSLIDWVTRLTLIKENPICLNGER